MTNNTIYPEFKFDINTGLEVEYIGLIRGLLWDARENITPVKPYNSKRKLDCMVSDFFVEPRFALFKAQALYNTLTGILKQPLMDWKIVDEEWFTKLDKYYKKLLINSKLQQIEGDFKDGN